MDRKFQNQDGGTVVTSGDGAMVCVPSTERPPATGEAISRRSLLAWAGGTTLASSGAVPWTFVLSGSQVVAAPALAQDSWTPVTFDLDQARAVARLTDAIIPRTDTPGAIDAKVPEFLDLSLSVELEPIRARFLERLTRLDGSSRATYGEGLTRISDEQLQELLTQISDDLPKVPAEFEDAAALFKDLKGRTVFAYYTSLEGRTKELELPPAIRRTEWAGCGSLVSKAADGD